MDWPIAEAKNRLSELVTRASSEGPQTIRRRKEAFVVIPEHKYKELVGEQPTFKDWLLQGPRIDDLKIPPREGSPMRKVDL